MRDIGSISQLKADLDYGCILTIKLKNDDLPDNINELVEQISQLFAGNIIYRSKVLQKIINKFNCYLIVLHIFDFQLRLLRYFVCEKPLLWSSVFARMQQLSKEYQSVIEDYYVKEATIEAILQTIKTTTTITTD